MARWRGALIPAGIPAFSWVTSAAGLVIAASGLVDVFTSTGNPFGSVWTWCWIGLTLILAGTPILRGARFTRGVGLAGTIVFFLVTSLQLAVSTAPVASINNVVLYPMLATYLGWFYRRRVARAVIAGAFICSATSLFVNPIEHVFITWINLALASVFCLEAASYLKSKLDGEVKTDPLTGVLNRSGLDERIGLELDRASRSGLPMTIAIFDLDDFKHTNDTQGHAAGDQLLIDFARGLQETTRRLDTVARIGGDEFLIVMPDTTADDATSSIDRFRDQFGTGWSFRLAQASPGDTPHSLRDRADRQLYALKNARRRPPQ
ncbi:GGDEF domain-containing protein [Subtercola sp. YIM 133946]|uniref:GGDEF domain-containing protein n=1 Tax=Subtercola sp. YIM 133946 TaxID=3118909 RepID=UPI002F923D45